MNSENLEKSFCYIQVVYLYVIFFKNEFYKIFKFYFDKNVN